MHIVTGSDDNYAAGVMVLIASAAWHTPGLRATVLDMGISADNRARIDALAKHLGLGIDRIEISADQFSHMKVKRPHLNRSTYLRLLIPDLMPDEARVVYMDCDMVVMGDLTPLALLDLGHAMVAAVPCPSPDARELADTGIGRGEYVNAGLLVMNLPVWRAEDVAGQCARLLSDPGRDLLNEDQSAINIVARHRILPLPAGYNVFADPAAYSGGSQLPDDIRVLHYVVSYKPWKSLPTAGGIWRAHASAIRDFLPDAPAPTLRHRLSLMNRRRRIWVGLALGNPKYRALRRAEIRLNRMAQDYAAGLSAR